MALMGAMLESHHRQQLKPTTVPRFQRYFSRFGLPYQRKLVTDSQVTAGMCVSWWCIFWAYNV